MISFFFQLPLRIARHPVVAHLVFWLWNGLFISVAAFGLIPVVLVSMFREVNEGTVPVSLFLTTLVLVAIPFAATAIGAIFFRKRPDALRGFFFGVEAPLFLLGLARLFLVRELTSGVIFVLSIYALAAAIYMRDLFRAPKSKIIHLALSTVCLAAGSYITVLLAFYAVPLLISALDAALQPQLWWNLLYHPFRSMFGALFSIFAAASLSIFAALPLALIALYAGHFAAAFRAFARAHRPVPAIAVSFVVLLALGAGFARANLQPQAEAFELLEAPRDTDAQRAHLLQNSDKIRAGLLNAYLAEYRYVASRGRLDQGPYGRRGHMVELWHQSAKVDVDTAELVEDLFEVFASPWLYDGKEQAAKAAEHYAQFFDAPIQKAEKDAILRALETTWDRAERQAGLLDEGQRKVRVARQELSIVERGDYADVELHEIYENQTPEQQEIFYTFSLPSSAAITALYLGDTAERDRRFPFVVAPRGAAQAVYRAEVTRRVDPALLEQIGPRQYRLRAFPIPSKGVLHLWLEYQVIIDDGTIPLPQLSEKRNVYLDQRTERTNRAMPFLVETPDLWLPRAVPAISARPATAHTVVLGPNLAVRAEPIDTALLMPAPGGRYAIVLDRSRSMAAHAGETARSFAWLRESIMPKADVDLILTSAPNRGEPAAFLEDPSQFDPKQTLYFGGQNPREMLEQVSSLATKPYDAIVVLTDGGSYELVKDQPLSPLRAPLFLIHAGGALPPGYDDGTLEAIQSTGGEVHTDVRRAFAAIAFAARAETGQWAYDDGYVYTSIPRKEATDDESRFAPIAARQVIRAETRVLADSGARSIETLDHIHGIAKRHGVVSAYSSMIVLVNDEQRERLAAAEKASDRFHREVEDGNEVLSKPNGGFSAVTATPEPHEWALFFVAIGFMIVSRLRGASTFGTKTALNRWRT
jgi:putative PEP-CTERM system integral membrane protein